jgi:xanthosine utilization system XapX-like protein
MIPEQSFLNPPSHEQNSSVWSGVSIASGIIFIYIVLSVVKGFIFSLINVPTNANQIITPIFWLVAMFLGVMFGVKYVITRTKINQPDITKIAWVTAVTPLVIWFVFTILDAILGITREANQTFQFSVTESISAIVGLFVIFALTKFYLNKYSSSEYQNPYITSKHIWLLILLVIVLLGVRYLNFRRTQQAKLNIFKTQLNQIYKKDNNEAITKNEQVSPINSPSTTTNISSSGTEKIFKSVYGYQFSYPENYVVFSKIDSNANITPAKNDDFEVEVAKNSGLLTQGESATLNFKIVKTTLSPKAWLTQHLTDYTTPSEGRISDLVLKNGDSLEFNLVGINK